MQIAAARAWSIWEGSTLSLMQDPERVKLFGADNYAIAFARIECHYFVNRGFFERDDQLLADAHRIRHLPCTIVHGRYDVVTPVKSAWDLSRVWPEADLRIVADAGHAMTEPGIVHELVGATRRHATRRARVTEPLRVNCIGISDGRDVRRARRLSSAVAPYPIRPQTPSDKETAMAILKRGLAGEPVRRLQAKLGVTVDGEFGPNTETALKNWQTGPRPRPPTALPGRTPSWPWASTS